MNTAKILLPLRRLTQTLSVFLLVYIIWKTRYPLTGFINPEFYFQLDPFAMFITSLAERVLLAGLVYSSLTLLFTFFIGRAFCGWICPLGATLDFFSSFRSLFVKLARKREREPEPGYARIVKYAILGALAAASFFGIQFAWFFDPITIFVRTFSFNVHPFVNRVVDSAFMRLITATGYPETLQSLYDWLREGFLSISVPVFPHAGIILGMLCLILLVSFVMRRFWCRYICPLGATLALPARLSPFRRDVSRCVKNCGVCKNICRMNAIKSDNSYIREECVLCMDCVVLCPNDKTTFGFISPRRGKKSAPEGPALSRGEFMLMAGGMALSLAGFTRPVPERKPAPGRPSIFKRRSARSGAASLLRPPGALPEEEFVQRCIRCGNCMKVCPVNALTPSAIGAGPAGTWTPVFDTTRGYCEYQCNLCGRVCPTDAIRELPLAEKKKFRIGIAFFNKKICLPYARGENCIVCEEHCPVENKAIKLRKVTIRGKAVMQPYIEPKLCIGCAICENKCPVVPDRGVIVLRVKDV